MPEYPEHEAHNRAIRAGFVPAEDQAGTGGVAVIRGGGIPLLRCRVLEGQTIRVPAEHELAKANKRQENFTAGDEFVCEGPTAHHLEELGYVQIVEVSK
jgi:hypothetical protein